MYRRLFDFRVDVIRKANFTQFATNTSNDMRGLRRKFLQPKSSCLPKEIDSGVLDAIDDVEARYKVLTILSVSLLPAP